MCYRPKNAIYLKIKFKQLIEILKLINFALKIKGVVDKNILNVLLWSLNGKSYKLRLLVLYKTSSISLLNHLVQLYIEIFSYFLIFNNRDFIYLG